MVASHTVSPLTPPTATAKCCNGSRSEASIHTSESKGSTATTDLYGIDKFTFEPERNVYICPEGKPLTYTGISAYKAHQYRSTLKRCRNCPQKAQCTQGKYRVLQIHTCEPAQQRAHELAKTPAFDISQRARRKVEALFAELKNQIGLRRLRLRRLRFVREQFYCIEENACGY